MHKYFEKEKVTNYYILQVSNENYVEGKVHPNLEYYVNK